MRSELFDSVSPQSLSLTMKEMGVAPMLAGASLREQIGGKYEKCLQELRVFGILLHKSIKQEGRRAHAYSK